jgi:hypothetical protein
MTDPEAKAREIVEKDWEWWDGGTREIIDGELIRVIATALREARNSALEEAAGVAEKTGYVYSHALKIEVALGVAKAIRALKDTTP